jgi:hypothetical protein
MSSRSSGWSKSQIGFVFCSTERLSERFPGLHPSARRPSRLRVTARRPVGTPPEVLAQALRVVAEIGVQCLLARRLAARAETARVRAFEGDARKPPLVRRISEIGALPRPDPDRLPGSLHNSACPAPCIGTLRSMRPGGQPLFADRLRATLRGEAQLDTPGARSAKALRQLAAANYTGVSGTSRQFHRTALNW